MDSQEAINMPASVCSESGSEMPKGQVRVTAYELHGLPSKQVLQHWKHEVGGHSAAIKEARITPWMSFTCLAGAAVTSLVTLAVLLIIHNRPLWPTTGIYKVMQPASWISALLSVNSFLISLALAQGVTITWWRHASREHTTIADLHRIWATGDSLLSAVQHIKHGTYLTFAIIAAALLPLNGFLLQGAITTRPSVQTQNVTIPVPMVPFFDLGFSAIVGQHGYIDVGGTTWAYVWQQIQNSVGSSIWQYAYFGSELGPGEPYDTNYDESAIYHTRVNGTGFSVSCEHYSKPYDLLPTKTRPNTAGRVFQSYLSWNESIPNEMILDVYWKPEYDCIGNYSGKRCHLRAATVEYPVQVQMNLSLTPYRGPFYSLKEGTTRFDDRTIRVLDQYKDEGSSNWTYAGIAQSVGAYFNASLDVSDTFEVTNTFDFTNATHDPVVAEGQLTGSLPLGYNYNPNGNYYCSSGILFALRNLWYLGSLTHPGINQNSEEGEISGVNDFSDITEMILDRLRTSMFVSSVYQGSQWYTNLFNSRSDSGYLEYDRSHYVQNVEAQKSKEETIYEVRWYLWATSLALNWLIIGMIVPTFWEFWKFKTEPSMSPVDVARIFRAPAVGEVDPSVDTNTLLREVGDKRLHEPAFRQVSADSEGIRTP